MILPWVAAVLLLPADMRPVALEVRAEEEERTEPHAPMVYTPPKVQRRAVFRGVFVRR